MNRIGNKFIGDKEIFQTSNSADGCTQGFSSHKFKTKSGQELWVTDTPGTNDPELSLTKWIRLLRGEAKNRFKGIDLALVVFESKPRPSTQDKSDWKTVAEALRHANPNTIAIVFTKCDERPVWMNKNNNEPDKSKCAGWLNKVAVSD